MVFTSGNPFPVIDGSETFAGFDFPDMFMDGRSFAESSTDQQTLQRTNCGAAAPLSTSWRI